MIIHITVILFFVIGVYNSERYLATAKHSSNITQIEDITVGNAELDINVEDAALPNVINNLMSM